MVNTIENNRYCKKLIHPATGAKVIKCNNYKVISTDNGFWMIGPLPENTEAVYKSTSYNDNKTRCDDYQENILDNGGVWVIGPISEDYSDDDRCRVLVPNPSGKGLKRISEYGK